MATQTGVYTDPLDLLSSFRTFASANGWAENLYTAEGSGQRLHIQKTVGSTTFYFNFRAAVNEALVPGKSYYGILSNASTGFDAGVSSLGQPGAPSSGGYIFTSSSLGSYRFVASDSFVSMIADNKNGNTSHGIYTCSEALFGVFCSGVYSSSFDSGDAKYYERSFLRAHTSIALYGCHVRATFGWIPLNSYRGQSNNMIQEIFRDDSVSDAGYVIRGLLDNTPNTTIGIPVCFPFVIFAGSRVLNTTRQYDGVSGLLILNKKYIENGQAITLGGETYAVYESNPDQPDYGIAYKIS